MLIDLSNIKYTKREKKGESTLDHLKDKKNEKFKKTNSRKMISYNY